MQLDGAVQFPNVLMSFCQLFVRHFFLKFLHMYLEEGGKRVKNINEANILL